MSETPRVRIREVFKTKHETNPISGHSWSVHGPTTGYEIVGPFGVVAKHRTLKVAERERDEWESLYNRMKAEACQEDEAE